MTNHIDTVLVANRGEIACRVMRTLRAEGVRSVAVHSAADAAARHTREADLAVAIGPAPARESYLVAEKLLDAARRTGAQAIHPGYGFLSENAEFAKACEDAGIIFIGPPASAIETMGDKITARAAVEARGVPTVPGISRPGLTDEEIIAAGHEATTEILNYNHRRATDAIAAQLAVPIDSPVVELERLRKRDGAPVAILYNWLPAAITPPRDKLENHGLYELLREAGVELASTTQSVGAERPDRREAKLLAISLRDPVLTIDRTAFDPRGAIIEWGFHIYRADLYRYESTVFAQG